MTDTEGQQARVRPWAALAHRDYRLLYIGLLGSMIGSQMSRMANAWQVFQLTDSAMALGLAGVFAALPLIPMSLLGGALADAVERRRLMLAMQAIMLLTSVALAVLTLTHSIQVWHIYVAGFLTTVTGVLDRPARQAIIPSLVPREHLLNAYTLMTTLMQVGGLIGPALAGFVLWQLGPAAAYLIDAASFLMVIFVLLIMRIPPIAGGSRRVSMSSIVDGLRFVWSKQLIVGLFGLDIIAMLFGFYQTLLPVFARDLGVGEQGFGLLATAPAAGALIGASIMLLVGHVRRPGLIMLGAVGAYGLSLIGLGMSQWFPLALFFAGLLGLTDAVSMALRHTTIQLATPDEYRGRVSSAMQISVQGGNSVGAINSGVAGELLGAGQATALGGILVIISTVIFGWLVKPMRTHRI